MIVTTVTDFLPMEDSAHAGVLFVGEHRAAASEIASAIYWCVEAVPDREHLRDAGFMDSWR